MNRFPAELSQPRILVADDNEDTATGLAIVLKTAGFTVVSTVFGGLDAVRALRWHCPDVAMLDIVLPQIDGYQIASLMKTWTPPRPRLIAITGLSRVSDRLDAIESGFIAHFAKPADWNRLYKLLSSVAEQGPGAAGTDPRD